MFPRKSDFCYVTPRKENISNDISSFRVLPINSTKFLLKCSLFVDKFCVQNVIVPVNTPTAIVLSPSFSLVCYAFQALQNSLFQNPSFKTKIVGICCFDKEKLTGPSGCTISLPRDRLNIRLPGLAYNLLFNVNFVTKCDVDIEARVFNLCFMSILVSTFSLKVIKFHPMS